jgi:hypothetical protein
VLRYYMFFQHQPAWARPSRWAENAQRSGRFFERRRPAPGRPRGSKVLRDCMSSPDFSRNAHRDASPIARWGHPAPCHPWGSKVLRDNLFLPDFSENAHGGTTPPYLVRGIRPLATRGDQRCCVTTCFSSISRPGLGPAVGPKTPNVRADFSNGADRPPADPGDQRCCVTACFLQIFRETPTETPAP